MSIEIMWGWPQWAIVVYFFLHLVVVSARHGDEIREVAGLRKGEPARYNFLTACLRVIMIGFFLVAGGFFA